MCKRKRERGCVRECASVTERECVCLRERERGKEKGRNRERVRGTAWPCILRCVNTSDGNIEEYSPAKFW